MFDYIDKRHILKVVGDNVKNYNKICSTALRSGKGVAKIITQAILSRLLRCDLSILCEEVLRLYKMKVMRLLMNTLSLLER